MVFLKKRSTWGQELKKAPAGLVPCAGGCGSFGTSRTDNFCGLCYSKLPKTAEAALWKGILGTSPHKIERKRQSEDMTASNNMNLDVGVAVKLHSLLGAKQLNGRCGWVVSELEQSGRLGVKLKGEESVKMVKAANLRLLTDIEPLDPKRIKRKLQTDKTRCWHCSRKCGLTGFECRCGYVFCSRHRHAEDHDCSFDFKHEGQRLLAKRNPKLQANAWGHVA